MEYFCCGLHHSMYCPDCLGKFCKDRVIYGLNPEGGNEALIEEINKKEIIHGNLELLEEKI